MLQWSNKVIKCFIDRQSTLVVLQKELPSSTVTYSLSDSIVITDKLYISCIYRKHIIYLLLLACIRLEKKNFHHKNGMNVNIMSIWELRAMGTKAKKISMND